MPKRCFEVIEERRYDVVVVGGGTTGIAAAVAAAREGARVLLIDALGFLGGNSAAIPAWLGFHDLAGRRVVAGIAQEVVELLQREGAATPLYPDPICGSVVGIDVNLWKPAAMSFTCAAGVDVLLHSLVVDTDVEGAAVRGVYCHDRGGMRLLRAAVVIDCTDAGDVARHAGAVLRRGRDKDGRVQVASWVFAVGGIDFPALLDYFRRVPGDIRPYPGIDPAERLKHMAEDEVFVMGSFRALIERAQRDGRRLPRALFPGIAFPRRGELFSVATRVEDADPLDPWNLTRAEAEGMRQVAPCVEFLRHCVPGFANCRLVWTPHAIGLRETCHLAGDYTLTAEDLLAGRQFDDAVACGAFHLDIHTPDHRGLETARPRAYSIPYRCLLPKGLDRLLVAGRAISATHEAMSSTRVIPTGMAMGQAAGLAAATAARAGSALRDVDIGRLQARLRETGALTEVTP
jgi:hypothetical protein